MKQYQTIRKRRGSAGQSLVEFALVLPIFLLIFLGVVDFGRAIYTKHILDKAAREAARAGAVRVDEAEAIQTARTAATNVLTSLHMNSETQVDVNVVNVNGAPAISVSTRLPFSSFFTTGQFAIIKNLTLTSNVTMRKEG